METFLAFSIISMHRAFRELFQPSVYQTSHLERNLVSVVRFFAGQQKVDTILQLVSLFPIDAGTEGFSERSLSSLCSSHIDIVEGMSVHVTAPGNTTRFAIVIHMLERRKCCIQLLDRDDEERRKRYSMTLV
jgi:hypothetical protein